MGYVSVKERALEIELEKLKKELQEKERDLQEELLDRINMMGFAYGRIYPSDSGEIPMWGYVTAIVSRYTFPDRVKASVDIDIPADMTLPAESGVACGWIINELMSKIFSDRRASEISEVKVSMRFERTTALIVEESGKFAREARLAVSASGTGGAAPKIKFRGIWFGVLMGLVEQIRGEIVEFDTGGFGTGAGIKFDIRFPVPLKSKAARKNNTSVS